VGTGFHAELTGRENIFLNGAVLGMRRHEIERRFDEIVAFAEVEQFLETPVKHYSSGMYMRLAFAVAAHLEPEILMVDEVLAVGDIAFQRKCLGKMREVAKSGRTVLFVSHNVNAVEELCQSALLLEHGRVVRLDDDVRSVLKQYLFGEQSASLVAEWQNRDNEHRNPWFTPQRFFIADAQGGCHPIPVSNDDEFYVQIEGDIAQPEPSLTVGYAIYAEDGTLLYWSLQTDGDEPAWPKLDRGRCVIRSRVPARFLNEGAYRVELIASLHNRHWIMQPGVNAPQMTLVIQGGLSASPLWVAKRPGVLGPVLAWDRVN
jgi:lipopolysaccharide transport system ATP-binding protein